MPGTEVTKNDKARRYAAPEIFATAANYQSIEIASVRTVTKTRAEERRAFLIGLATGLGIPLLCNASSKATTTTSLSISAASARPTRPLSPSSSPSPSAPSPPSNVVRPLSLFPLYTPLTHLSFFVVLSIKSFYNSRSQFHLLLSASAHANLNLNRYLHLMALASTDLLFTVPFTIFVLYSNVAIAGLSPGSPGQIRTRESFDSFCDTDLSASYGGISPLESDAEKAALEYEGAGGEKGMGLTLGDVSGMLPDYKETCGGDAEEGDTEVSSLHRASVHITLSPPEPAHIRRASADVPMPVVVRDATDIV
ncbi:hypothetical protein B0H13DRAFT_2388965 [Mycena leptocephala]|nr:hypothetical protein B0H13DRAFT_2388965 [Mycena leptocephala]